MLGCVQKRATLPITKKKNKFAAACEITLQRKKHVNVIYYCNRNAKQRSYSMYSYVVRTNSIFHALSAL